MNANSTDLKNMRESDSELERKDRLWFRREQACRHPFAPVERSHRGEGG